MSMSSMQRRRLSRMASQLLALRDEKMTSATAVALVKSEGSLSSRVTTDEAAPLSSALRDAAPSNAIEVVDFVRLCESQGRGDDALRLLARAEPKRFSSRGPQVIVVCEIAVLMVVLLVYSLFVMPALKATFDAYGATLPAFTHYFFVGVSSVSPVILLLAIMFIIGLLWRALPVVFGPLIKPLDRLVLTSPYIGSAIRQDNSTRMAGWLGFAPTDDDGWRAAIAAARVWSPPLLSRICTRVLARDHAESDVTMHLAKSRAFDREFVAAATMENREEMQKAMRARWRLGSDARDEVDTWWAGLFHIALGIVIGSLVIAMYLPIFRIGSLS